jgi:hypothetical protein
MKTEDSKSQASRVHERQVDLASYSLDDLLAMASHYRSNKDLRQAEDIYWMLTQDHSGTPQAAAAKDRLRELAHEYERDGCAHEARAIYERLL